MPKFWGVLEPGLQRPGGKFWWAELDYAFKVWLDLTVGMLEAGKSSAGFGVQIPLSVAMDGRGVSGPAAFNVQLALVIGMTRPAPIPAGFGVSLPVSVSMVGTEQYARNLAVNVPVSIGMAGASKSVGAFGVSLPLSVGMAGSFVPGDIQFIGGDSAESSTSAALTAAITGQKAGDLVLLFGFRDGSTTAPTIPAGFTQYGATASGNSCCSWIAYRYATADAEAGPGTVTNATGLVRHVYRAAFVQMLGSIVNQNASSATITYPAMSMTNVDTGAKSWAVAFAGHRSTNGSLASPPAGMTNRTSLEGATNDLAGHDTGAGGVASWSAQTVASGETSSGYCVQEVEIWPAGVMSFENVNLTGITTPAGKSARLRMRGAGASGGSANKPSSGGWGGGGGGGGAYVDVTLPPANLGATFNLTRGLGGAAPAGNAANNGNAGGDSTFTSGASTVTAGGGQGGQAGGSGTSAGGTGGTVAVPAGITPAISENGAPGGNGSRVAGAGSQGGDSTHAGPGGGGGGSNTSSQYAGGPGGISGDETARAAGGSAGGGTGGAGTNAPTVDGAGSAGGGGGGNSGFGGTGGTGGLGGTSGAGGGGAGGKEGSTGSGGAGQAGAPGYTRLDFV